MEKAEWLALARSQRKENRKFLLSLTREKKLDDTFHELHHDVFEHTDCLTCANCCKTTSPIFRDVDIDRIATHLGIRPSVITEKYLLIDRDGDWVLNQSPCVFLGDDNRCSIYDVRPRACRDYPHTDRKNMAQILELTYRNSLICPAVSEITERLRQALKNS